MPRLILLLALAASIPIAALAAPPATATPGSRGIPEIPFEKHVLPNGLQVILHVDRKLPIVHVNQWFHVGSKNEARGRTGFAHLFEHLMFLGSKNANEDYFVYAERLGANLREGGVNGTTNHDCTNYFATVPSANLESLLWLESDRLATLSDVTDQAKLDKEREVVRNERRQNYESEPYAGGWLLLPRAVFPEGHPYSWPIIGSHEDLAAATLEDVKDFFRRYYTPNNLSLVIAGDFEPDVAKQLVEKYFGGIPPGPALERPARWVPALDGEKVFEIADRVPQERVVLAWPTSEFFAKGDVELTLAARILGDGLSSRLQRALVYERQLCTTVQAFQSSREIAGVFAVIATARPGSSLAEVEQVIDAEIARLAKAGPSAAELVRGRNKEETEFVSGLERIGGFGGKADVLNRYNTFLGDPGKVSEDLGRLRAATPESVRAAVARWIDTRSRVVVRFRPERSGRPAQVELDRTRPPATGSDSSFQAPEVKAAKLANGLEVLVVERADLPKVHVRFLARAGSVADGKGKGGLGSLTLASIDKGTKSRAALALADALGNLGIGLERETGRETASLTLDVLKRNLPAALGLLADVVRNPVFPAQEVERERKQQLDALAQLAQDPTALARRLAGQLAFGFDHPYGRPELGLGGTVEGLNRADVVAFHAARFRPGGSALVFVGAVTLAEARALAEREFGSWSGGAPEAIVVPPPRPVARGKVVLVDRQDSPQSAIVQVQLAPPSRAADFYALAAADSVYGGGGFGTRLNLNLRETKGYSYGVFSVLMAAREATLWFATGEVQTDKTKESLVELRKELADLAGGRPIAPEEFEAAKQRKLRGYAQGFESYWRIAERVARLWTLGLPSTELQREADVVAALTEKEVNAAARAHARPGEATLIVVGDRSKVEKGLAELGLEVVELDSEGKPAKATTSSVR
ncbi:MAG: insulinase family protein [Deltaproteobacteria bacterium]|nr:insulinase family protein [Deltaproteobacteria bacterium]